MTTIRLAEIDDSLSVCPAEVAALSGWPTGTRIYLKGSGCAYLTTEKPIGDVIRALATAGDTWALPPSMPMPSLPDPGR